MPREGSACRSVVSFPTEDAIVTVRFVVAESSQEDVLAALDEARAQANSDKLSKVKRK